MQLHAYLMFNGNCAEAFRFYQKCLGGDIDTMMTFGESPACGDTPPEWRDKIMHASLRIGDAMLMASDSPPQYHETPGSFAVSINVDDPAEADRIFGALSEKGTVRMAMEETFWARRFGMLVDRFGIPWMVNCGKPT